MTNEQMIDKAEELSESFINGNKTYVRDEILRMNKKEAVAIALFMAWAHLAPSGELSAFIRMFKSGIAF